MWDTGMVDDTDEGSSSLGKRLGHIREAAGLTQAALAAALDTGQPYISMIETGARLPGRDIIRRWVEACGRRLDMVFSRTDGAPLGEVSHYLDTMPPEHAIVVAKLVRLLAMSGEKQRARLSRMIESMIELQSED
jgi:transcriptional regulator with XRE-family HTH domain